MARNEVTSGIDNPSYVATLSNTLTPVKNTTSTVTPVTTPTTQPVAASSATPAAPKPIPPPSSSPNYGPFTLTAAQGHLLVLSTVGGGIVLALLGIGLLFGAALIGRRVRTPDVAVESDGDNE